MPWVVEIRGYDIAAATEKTLRFAMGRGVAFTDQPYAPAGLKKWSNATQKIDIDRTGQVKGSADAGTLELINLPDDIAIAGPLEGLHHFVWQNRPATLYWAPTRLWADAVKTASGILEQPIADVQGSSLVFNLRDPRAALDVALQAKKFGGTNVAGAGVDGEADIKGKPLPVLYGIVSNIPGVRVNQQKLIWMLADVSAVVLCVRDGGVPYTAGTVRGSLASLQSNIPIPGTYDTYRGAEGTFVRLGTSPFKILSFDVAEGAAEANRTHAQVWKRLRLERCATVSGDIDAGSVTDLDAIAPKEVGFWWPDEISRRDAMDQLFASLSGYEVQDTAGDWHVASLVAPSGTPAINLVVLSASSFLKLTDRPVTSLTRVRPNFAPSGTPPYRVNVNWGKNYTTMSASDFLGAADQRLRDKFAQEWRTETATSATVWDPVAGTGFFPDAPELTINTGYQPGADGVTCPHAATEATARLALYSTLRQQFTVGFVPQAGDHFLPGDVTSLTYPSYGLDTGPLFRVLQAGITVENMQATAQLVIGLQT